VQEVVDSSQDDIQLADRLNQNYISTTWIDNKNWFDLLLLVPHKKGINENLSQSHPLSLSLDQKESKLIFYTLSFYHTHFTIKILACSLHLSEEFLESAFMICL